MPGRVLDAVDRGRDAAGEEALDDLDELDHGVADVAVALGIEAVRLDHQRAGADQQVAEAGARADAGMAVMRRVGGGEKAASSVSPARKTRSCGTKTSSKSTTPVDWPYLAENFAAGLAGPAGRPRDDGDARRVHRHRAADREVGVLRQHACGTA